MKRNAFTQDHEMFRDTVRQFFQTELLPHHEQWEEDGEVPREVWTKAGELGILGPMVPEEYGGLGLDYGFNAIVSEETGHSGVTGFGGSIHNDIVLTYLYKYGSEVIKQKYLPKSCTGEYIGALGMSEPGAGSDLAGIRTMAVKDGDEYVINGSKIFISNGYMCDYVVIACVTDPSAGHKGVSLIVVDTTCPGFKKGRKLKKLGMKAQDTAELFFEDCRVPAENVLGQPGMGFIYMMQALAQERLAIAVVSAAAARSVIEQTVVYTKERKAFGRAVADFQNTQFVLADLDIKMAGVTAFVDNCIAALIEGDLSAEDASRAKVLASDVLGEVTDKCLQLHGGYGYMWEYPVCKQYADARVQRIYGGTNEIMKTIIAKEIFK